MKLLLLLAAALSGAAGYRYLVVFPMPSPSHGILGKGIVTSLLQEGHEVTYVTPFPEKNSVNGVQYVNASFMFEILHTMPNFFKKEKSFSFTQIKEVAHNFSVYLVQNEVVQSLMKDKKQKFDAVITEWFFSDLYSGFAQTFQCPWILFSPVGMTSNMEYLVDEVQSPATSPNLITGFTVPMSLKERLINSFLMFMGLFQTIYLDHPKEALAYEKYFRPSAEARGIQLAEYTHAVHNIAMLYLNTHPSLGQPFRLPPNAIEIGGYHIDAETKPLPKDLQDIMDNSPHGVIYFSMGSNLKSADMPEDMRSELLGMFGRLEQTVLWKFEVDMKNTPKNVHVRPWMPQQSILAHKNMKVFITHGGMLSTTETTFFGIPIIAIPVFGDQFVNAMRSEKRGIGISVQLNEPNLADNLENAIKKILENPKYGETARRLSGLLRDRPVPPARLVSYWAEYAVRTAGAPHLRTAASSVPAYQRYLLDTFAIIFAVLLLFAWLLRALFRLVFKRRSSAPSKATTEATATSKKKKRS